MRKSANEYAKELVNKFSTYVTMWSGGVEVERANVKQCALITIEELINAIPWEHGRQSSTDYKYYQEVKQAINDL